eukprot:evm.model.scf_474.1 EVM.evm.TU.scf_474.1   scf_474:3451-21135(-)
MGQPEFAALLRAEEANWVCFKAPVCITHVRVGNARIGGPGQALLRMYARDLNGLSGSRFVALCGGTVTCPEDGVVTIETEAITTDHVALRGRYESLQLAFLGRCHRQVKEEISGNAGMKALPMSTLPFPSEQSASHPRPTTDWAGLALPHLEQFSDSVANSINILDRFRGTALQHKGPPEESTLPEDVVRAMFSSADILCGLLGLGPVVRTSRLQDEPSAGDCAVSNTTLDTGSDLASRAADLAVLWCEILARNDDFPPRSQPNRGMVGLALAVVVCSCRPAAVRFVAKQGIDILTDVFRTRRCPALITRYVVCACELLTLTCPALACDTMLGWWQPSQRRRRPPSPPALPPNVIHVPGIVEPNVNFRKRDPPEEVTGSVCMTAVSAKESDVTAEAEDRTNAAADEAVPTPRNMDSTQEVTVNSGTRSHDSQSSLKQIRDEGPHSRKRMHSESRAGDAKKSKAVGDEKRKHRRSAGDQAGEGATHHNWDEEQRAEQRDRHGREKKRSRRDGPVSEAEASCPRSRDTWGEGTDFDAGEKWDNVPVQRRSEREDSCRRRGRGNSHERVRSRDPEGDDVQEWGQEADDRYVLEKESKSSRGREDRSGEREAGWRRSRWQVDERNGYQADRHCDDYDWENENPGEGETDRDKDRDVERGRGPEHRGDEGRQTTGGKGGIEKHREKSKKRKDKDRSSGKERKEKKERSRKSRDHGTGKEREHKKSRHRDKDRNKDKGEKERAKGTEKGGEPMDAEAKAEAKDELAAGDGVDEGPKSVNASQVENPPEKRQVDEDMGEALLDPEHHPASADKKENLQPDEAGNGGLAQWSQPAKHTDNAVAAGGVNKPTLPELVEETQEVGHQVECERPVTKRRKLESGVSEVKDPEGATNIEAKAVMDVEVGRETVQEGKDVFDCMARGSVIYSMLVDAMTEPRAEGVAASSRRIVQRLNAYQSMQRIHTTVERACRHGSWAQGAFGEESWVQEVASALLELSSDLEDMHLREKQEWRSYRMMPQDEGKQLGPVFEIDTCVLECFVSRRLLQALAMIIHAVRSQKLQNHETSGTGNVLTGQLATERLQAVLCGVRSVLGRLLLSTRGLGMLRHQQKHVLQLLSALESGTGRDGTVDGGQGQLSGVQGADLELAESLRGAMLCGEAVDVVLREPMHSQKLPQAVQALIEGAPAGTATRACALRARTESLEHCLKMLQSFRQLLQCTGLPDDSVTGAPTGPTTNSAADPVVTYPAAHSVLLPGCLAVPDLLLAVVRDGHATSIAWLLPKAKDLAEEVEVGLKLLEKADWEHRASKVAILGELLGRLQACSVLAEKGSLLVLEQLDDLLPKLAASAKGKEDKDGKRKRNGDVEAPLCAALLRDPQALGSVLTGLDILAVQLASLDSGQFVTSMYGADALQVMERAVRSATAGLLATAGDTQWTMMGGDTMDDLERIRHGAGAMDLALSAARSLLSLCKALRDRFAEVCSTGVLEALVELHAVLCLSSESLAAMLGKGRACCSVLQARQLVVCIMSCWIEMEWVPDLIPTLFGMNSFSTEALPTALLDPSRVFCCTCLLGDIFPKEWPPAMAGQGSTGRMPPPSNMKMRPVVARMLEPFAKHFRHVIAFGAASESQLVRGSVVRLCSRASGLGGGMGRFLAEPLVSEVAELAKSTAPAGDGRRVVEMLAALAGWPAMKAALLDLGAVSALSQLLHRAASRLEEHPDSQTTCSLVLDVLSSLTDPDICLNPLATRVERLKNDCPPTTEAAVMVTALLSSIQYLGDDAAIAASLIKQMSFEAAGRAAIQSGIGQWHASHRAATSATSPSGDRQQAAMRWAKAQLWEAGGHMLGKDNTSVAGKACRELLEMLSFTEAGEQEDQKKQGEQEDAGEDGTAPSRFKAAVQTAVRMASSTGDFSDLISKSTISEILEVRPLAFVYDTAMQLYWQRCSLQKSRTSPAKKLGRYDPQSPGAVPAAKMFSPGLATRKRPREVHKGVYSSSTKQEAPRIVHSLQVEEDARRPRKGIEGGKDVGPDVPPVLAPPRRGQEARRVRTGAGSSRPPSMHVDDFEKRNVDRPVPPPVAPAVATQPAAASVVEAAPASGQKPLEGRRSIPPAPPRPPLGPPPPGTPAAAIEQAKAPSGTPKAPSSKPDEKPDGGSVLDGQQGADTDGQGAQSEMAASTATPASAAADVKDQAGPDSPDDLSMADFKSTSETTVTVPRPQGPSMLGSDDGKHPPQGPSDRTQSVQGSKPATELGAVPGSGLAPSQPPPPPAVAPLSISIPASNSAWRGSAGSHPGSKPQGRPRSPWRRDPQGIEHDRWPARPMRRSRFGAPQAPQRPEPMQPQPMQPRPPPVPMTNSRAYLPRMPMPPLPSSGGRGRGPMGQGAHPPQGGLGRGRGRAPGLDSFGRPGRHDWDRQMATGPPLGLPPDDIVAPGLGLNSDMQPMGPRPQMFTQQMQESPRSGTPSTEVAQVAVGTCGTSGLIAPAPLPVQSGEAGSAGFAPNPVVGTGCSQQEGPPVPASAPAGDSAAAQGSGSMAPSAASIANLLRDPDRLKRLLKHHPQLTAVLQGHLGGPRPGQPPEPSGAGL